jgi:hypothetical protein
MKIHVGDKIEFKPRYGRQRIVEVTRIYPTGFDAVPTGARHVKVFGYHEQVIRVLACVVPDVPHRTKVVGLGDDWVAWVCTCGHVDMGKGDNAEQAMKAVRVQQAVHKRSVLDKDDEAA